MPLLPIPYGDTESTAAAEAVISEAGLDSYRGEITFTGSDVLYSDLSSAFTAAGQWGFARKTDNSIFYLVVRFRKSENSLSDFYSVSLSAMGVI